MTKKLKFKMQKWSEVPEALGFKWNFKLWKRMEEYVNKGWKEEKKKKKMLKVKWPDLVR